MDLKTFFNNPGNLAAMSKALNSPEGRALRERLKSADKTQIQNALANMGITGSTSPETLKKLAADPSVLAKLNELLKR